MYAGLSGIQLPIPKYRFPPGWEQASRLAYYASFFNSIEINSSFYKIPLSRTVARWATSVPANFKFTFKLFKGVTHEKKIACDGSILQQFFHAVNHVGTKAGCILVQFPPSVGVEAFSSVAKLAEQLEH